MTFKKTLKTGAVIITSVAATINCFAGMTFAWDFAEKRLSPPAYAMEAKSVDDVPLVRCILETEAAPMIAPITHQQPNITPRQSFPAVSKQYQSTLD